MLIDKNIIKWVWIDLDDTLWDFAGNSIISLVKLYHSCRLEPYFNTPENFCLRYQEVNHALWADYNVGRISRDYLMSERFERPLKNAGYPIGPDTWKRFSDLYLDYLGECTQTVPGAVELLNRLRGDGFKIGIISNGFKEVQFRKLNSSNISHLIDCVVLSDEIGVNKPDIRLFIHAVAKAGFTPAQALIIGDNPDTDILGGLNAGWQAVYFNRDGKGKPSQLAPTVTSLNQIHTTPTV